MKLVYSSLLFLSSVSLLFAQQTFSSFPISIDKSDYDDRESVFITDEIQGAGVFISDHSVVNFVKLDEKGEASYMLKQNMPSTYTNLKRAGVGMLNDSYICYFLQGNKKINMLQADVKNKSLVFSAFPFTDKDPILFIASGIGYLYVVTSSGDLKNELTIHKYTSLVTPVITKIKTQDTDLYKALSINTNKAVDQIAVMPTNTEMSFTQTALAIKAYHNIDQLIITYDAPEGEVRMLKLNSDNPAITTFKSGELEKKIVFRSVIFKDQIFMLIVNSKKIAVKSANLIDQQVTDAISQLDPDFYYESSYSTRIGYNRERKGITNIELIKLFNRSDLAGLGVMETSNGKTVLIAGLANKNNISDPEMSGEDDQQKGQLNASVTLERNYYDLHLPSYATDQNALIKFKKEIWVYTYWVIDEKSGKLSKAFPEDVITLDESLDLFYRDPLNNAAPALWKQNKNHLLGFYHSKNQTYNLYKMEGKPVGGNMNRR